MVRDRIPITVREWNKTKNAKESEYISERYKEGLWNDLMAHFTLPEEATVEDTEKLRLKVKGWTLMKMGELFRQWKKRLWQTYKKDKKAPKFEGYLAKQEHHWEEFVKYKTSEDWEALSAKNKKNAVLKKYHHNMGSAGYAGAMPKWDKKEAELLLKGVTPEPIREE